LIDAVAQVEAVGMDEAWFFEMLGRGYSNLDPFGTVCAAAAWTCHGLVPHQVLIYAA
jgi:alkanesulfonate monooxygenase SsuD/methylene tetrahydromethanopterin reductase-like flavin-dependent oxidoreductase (luciferase family)